MTITSAPTPDASERHLLAYERQRAQGRMQAARRELLEALAGASELEWLACARALVLRSDTEAAHAVLSAALVAHPGDRASRTTRADRAIRQGRGKSDAGIRRAAGPHRLENRGLGRIFAPDHSTSAARRVRCHAISRAARPPRVTAARRATIHGAAAR